ncbi:MAG: hypothetical protein BECKG1743D_GA0114223_100201 [Candidatus Kentron sp. G]|nr:MAG: hypothetical protein BECKG1743F_GA0114225_100591 [Candidatus Kentron sp. G]VFM96147.1 MAG: hypothetical protein BECKG1743E_GA0114224_100391 [Candidatus Kentron sp. G]VFM97583.1 MAG: hypothetical protein BECKG1743D_GA0114223_100201 [Candidatus Kentron sp. G]
MRKDAIIEGHRKIREEHAIRFNDNPITIYNDLKRLEKEPRRETVLFSSKPVSEIPGVEVSESIK